MEKYLDVKKSVIISSPAGSGKTERLARRYVSLLLSGARIHNILAITFTEKAAAEMKHRILGILKTDHPGLFLQIREKMQFMRISTIHSFCLKLLKRFSIELGLDPSLDVIDEFNASSLWIEAVYESLAEERKRPDLFHSMIVSRGIKGWNSLYRLINELHVRRPLPEILIKENHPVDGEERRIITLYNKCLSRYTAKKRERHLIDFNDIEILTHEALANNPQWQNILYSFDEHTDHILVDEFQDTSSLQWKIIDKLTEEWRSGIGAKRDRGKIPTIFLVGDDKQSIYLFRGAYAGVFQEAKTKLSEWLHGEFHFEEIKDNYRSLPEIVGFVNSLFAKIMPPVVFDDWRSRYTPFHATRKGEGNVELILFEGGKNMRMCREYEAAMLARKIMSLSGAHRIWDGETIRECTYGDMAVLLRKRTHLALYEEAFREYGIPFIVVKGIGFYEETEVALLRELLFLLIDPLDDYSLFCVLRSPLFGIGYGTLLRIADEGDSPLFVKISKAENKRISNAFHTVSGWLIKSKTTPYAVVLEDALADTGGWRYVSEPQKYANVRKFIAIIELFESQGFSGLEIREKLIQSREREEAKAHINTAGMNAVQIMTVHAAKGLQFPIVFLPGLDEDTSPKSSSLVIDEEGGRIIMAYEENFRKRRNMTQFSVRREKENEEEKRLFYVAVTRARDFLCMTAALNKEKKQAGRLKYITDNIDSLQSLKILRESDIQAHPKIFDPGSNIRRLKKSSRGQYFVDHIQFEPSTRWRDVTEDLDIRVRHGNDWVVLGKVFHILFDELSRAITPYERVSERSEILLRNEILPDKNLTRLNDIIRNDILNLERSGYLRDIILPQAGSYSEMPFTIQKKNIIYRGRIDRIIVRNSTACIYDYKTFPVSDRELRELIDHYRFQMDIYGEAAGRLFSMRTKGYLLFTHIPLLIEV